MTSFLEKHIVPIYKSTPWHGCISIDVLVGIGLGILFTLTVTKRTRIETIIDIVASLLATHYRAILHGEVRESPVCLQRNLRLALLSLLGSNNDDTIGCTRTIE